MAQTAGTSRARDWRLPSAASDKPSWTAQLPPLIAQLLWNRGIHSQAQLTSFMSPGLHDPQLLPGMTLACHRLARALSNRETVGVFGDFDVDGVTATALMVQGLTDVGATVVPYIPDRAAEGHGLNRSAVQALSRRGVSVLVTVDCGVTAIEEVALAGDLGMDVIVTDHHVPPPVLPSSVCVIDPKLASSEYPFSDLSGAGLALKLIQGLYGRLGRAWKPDLLELAALSTVADVVPLRDENRFLVKEGLKQLRRTRRPGLLALYRRAGLKPESIDAEAIGFMIAPRLNAAGRLEHASTSYRLLTTASAEEGEMLATRLETLNRERQQMTEEAHARARERVAEGGLQSAILMVFDPLVSPGIAGLVASRLVDEFYRPAVVMSLAGGRLRGSARSIREFDIGAALAGCGDLFTRHGGHRYAAGFEMVPENLPALEARLQQAAEETLPELAAQPLYIDAEVSVANLVGETFRWLRELEPFGVDNPAPAFLTRGLQPLDVRQMGDQGQHLRLKLKEGRVIWDAVAFRQGGQRAGDARLGELDVVYNLGTDWRGSTEVLALRVLDFRPA